MFRDARYLRSIFLFFSNDAKVMQNTQKLLLKLRWSPALLAGAFVFGCTTVPSAPVAHQPDSEVARQPDAEVAKRVQVSGRHLNSIFPGATVYGRFAGTDVTWVEHYGRDQTYFVQFSEPVSDKEYGPAWKSAKGWWEIKGVLLCFVVLQFEDLCTEVYRNGNSFQFVEPTSGETLSVTTKFVLADGSVID